MKDEAIPCIIEVETIEVEEPDHCPFTIPFEGSFKFSVSSTWNAPLPIGEQHEYELTLEHRKFLGIEWWPTRTRFTGVIKDWDGESMSVSSVSPIVVERAEWWRRLGYWIITLRVPNLGYKS